MGMSQSDRRSYSAICGSKRFMPLPAAYRSLSRPSSALKPSNSPDRFCSIADFLHPLHLCDIISSGVQDMSIFGVLSQTVSPQGGSASTASPIMSACWGALSILATNNPYINATETHNENKGQKLIKMRWLKYAHFRQ
jgi:hypothetical protein